MNDELNQLALDLVYGLLDDPEARERLATPEGQVALRRAESFRGLVSAAAKLEFPEATFAPPMPEPRRERQQLRRHWVAWVVAASLLAGLSVPASAYLLTGRHLERETELAVARADAAHVELGAAEQAWVAEKSAALARHATAQAELERLRVDRATQVAKARQDVLGKQFNVFVSGPAAITPGMPNEYQIETKTLAGQLTPSKLTTRVVDQAGRVVYEPPAVESRGTYRLKLPTDLPLTPDRELSLEVAAVGPAGPSAELKQKLSLAAPVYLAHLTTDKPLYQPGEVVRFRALVLDRFKLRPPGEDVNLTVTVLDPQGAELFTQTGISRLDGSNADKLHGLAAGEWPLPESAAGGEYTLRLREASGRMPEQTRKFLVNRYQPARLEKVLEFTRKSYGPGDEVVAACKASRVSGPLANQPVKASAQVDGRELPVELPGTTDANGTVSVKFKLPGNIDRGDASVSVTFTDGGEVETLNKPVPVVLNKLGVEFFPEGGELIAGVPNRVYVQARTPLGRPAQMRGRIVNANGEAVAAVETLTDDAEPGINQGQARFTLTPKRGEAYRLQVDQPVGIADEPTLPTAKVDGVALNTGAGVTSDAEPLTVELTGAGTERNLIVGVYARGRLLDHQRLTLLQGKTTRLTLTPTPGFGGVTRLTVFEERGEGPARQLVPLAERLVFRKPSKRVDIALKSDKLAYSPGEHVKLRVTAANEKGESVPAVAMLGVVNGSVVTMADEKTARSLPTHFLLTSEVEKSEDLEHVDVLLGNHPKAEAALDLLLGVQGWRRFVEQGPGLPPTIGQAKAAPTARVTTDVLTSTVTAAARKAAPALEKATRELDAASAEVERLTAETPQIIRLQEAVQKAKADAARLDAQRRRHQSQFGDTVAILLPLIALALAIITGGLLFVSLFRGRRYALASVVTATLAVVAANVQFLQTAGVKPGVDGAAYLQSETMLADAPKADVRLGAEVPGRFAGVAAAVPPKPAGRGGDFVGMTRGRLGDAAGQPEQAAGLTALERKPNDGHKHAEPAAAPVARKPRAGRAIAEMEKDRDDEAAKRPIAGQPLGPLNLNKKIRRDAPGANPRQQPARPLDELARNAQRDVERVPELREAFDRRFKNKGQIREPELATFHVREYAHIHPSKSDGVRDDFTETVYWHPALVLPGEGLVVTFDLSDAITRYQMLAAAHTTDGRLGAAKADLIVRKPLTAEPKLPVEITSGDRLDVPVTIANETDTPREVKLSVESPGLVPVGTQPLTTWTQPANSRDRRVFGFRPLHVEGVARLRFALADDDAVEVKLPVVPEGFPVQGAVSAELRSTAKIMVPLPATWVPGTMKLDVAVFPTPLADLQRGLEGLLQEPGGCFEQTSTTNYPNTLILDYLRETNQANPELVARAKGMLERGYTRLTGFEVKADAKREGYEWFGHAPAHEALTAYGLLQFRDMARVTQVDPQMIARTSNYLLSRRDGKGGFQKSKAALDSFGRAPDDVTNAYIVWAITESGPDEDVTPELNRLQEQAATAGDPYFLALVANAMLNRNRAAAAEGLLAKLVTAQSADGAIPGAQVSITGSRGGPLVIETTALAVLGWLKADHPTYTPALRSAVGWISKQRNGGGSFGPTQSTILALKSLVAYARKHKQPAEAGTLTLTLGDRAIALADFTADHQDAIVLDVADAEKLLKPGDNTLTLATTGKNAYPFTLGWKYQTMQPPSADKCAVRLSASLDRADLSEGDTTRLKVRLHNVSGQGQGMTVAIIGLPAGLKLPDDFKQLRDLARVRDGKPGPIAFFELRGRELILYWRDLAPDAKIDLALDVIAHVPGRYRGPASRAYLYYDPEAKHWVVPMSAAVRAGGA